MSIVTQLITSVYESLRANKSTFVMFEEEVTLSSHAKIFATLNLKCEFSDANLTGPFPIIKSSLYRLPADLMSKFRPVCLSMPDAKSIIKMQLIVHGFSSADELAVLLARLLSTWRQLAWMETMLSVKVISNIIADASDHLDKFKAQRSASLGAQDRVSEKIVDKEDEAPRANSQATARVEIEAVGANDVNATGKLCVYISFFFHSLFFHTKSPSAKRRK